MKGCVSLQGCKFFFRVYYVHSKLIAASFMKVFSYSLHSYRLDIYSMLMTLAVFRVMSV